MPAALLSSVRAIGLSIGETVVLGVLLRGGQMYAAQIAKESRLNRTTTYGFLNELIEKGLVSKFRGRTATLYQSIAPEMLPDYIARKREDLRKREDELRAALPQIMLMRSKVNIIPKVQFFEGDEGVKQAYEDTLLENKSGTLHDITGSRAVLNRFGPEWLRYYLQKRAGLGIECTDLAPEAEWSHATRNEDSKYRRVTKFLSSDCAFDAEISIYDNKVGFFTYAKESPVAIIIENDIISDAMKKLFAFMQQFSK